MDTFYSLPVEEQTQRYQEMAGEAITQWGIKDANIELIKYRENAVFSVTDNVTGHRYALRIHRFAYHSDAALLSELQWMEALNQSGIHTPSLVRTTDDEPFIKVSVDGIPEPHQCDLIKWIDGEALGSIEGNAEADSAKLVHNYRTVGRLAGRLHNHAETWKRPEGFERTSWDVDGLLGDNPLWGRFWELEALTDKQRSLILSAREIAKQQLREFGQSPDRYGLTHNDFLPENLLVAGDNIKIIDFDDSGFGWHLFEFATSVFFHLGEPYFNNLLDAMVEGYREVRPLPDEHLEKLPLFLLVRGLVYLGWVHTRKETETAQAVTPMLVEGVCALAQEFVEQQS